MIHYTSILGYILVTCHKNYIVTLHVTFMLYRRYETCLLGNGYPKHLPKGQLRQQILPDRHMPA